MEITQFENQADPLKLHFKIKGLDSELPRPQQFSIVDKLLNERASEFGPFEDGEWMGENWDWDADGILTVTCNFYPTDTSLDIYAAKFYF